VVCRRPLLAACAALTLAALGAQAHAGTAALPTLAPGTLTVAVDIPTPGLAEGSARGDAITDKRGFEVDLAEALARRLGLRLRLVDVPFARTFTAGPKPFDVALEHVTITAARRRNVDFSPPYFVTNKGLLLANGLATPRNLDELRTLRLCAQEQTTSIAYVRTQLKPRRAPRGFPTPVDVLRALSDGFCQGMVADLPILAAVERANPTLYGPLAGQIATHEHWGAVFAKGSPLRAPVSARLAALSDSGLVERLALRWFGPGWNRIPTLR
jgi:polar amino acid transport system substrate-binding protein